MIFVVNFYKEKKQRNSLSACSVSQVSSGNYPKASLSQWALFFFDNYYYISQSYKEILKII